MINIEYRWKDKETNKIVKGVITYTDHGEQLQLEEEVELRMCFEMCKAGYTLDSKNVLEIKGDK